MVTRILVGDALSRLREIPSESVQCVVTSPPYFGLRAYGTDPQVWGGDPSHDHTWDTVPSPGSRSSDTNPGPLQHPGNKNRERLTSDLCLCGAWRGELGLEPTPALFIEHLLMIFREVKRVLRPDGLLFVNLSDSYSNDAKWGGSSGGKHVSALHGQTGIGRQKRVTEVAAKSLFLIPERFVIAMQDDGWIVRQKIVWAKKAPMPESMKDRFTRAWEPIFMVSKQGRYFFDQEAVRQPPADYERKGGSAGYSGSLGPQGASPGQSLHQMASDGANMRDVWLLGPEPSSLEHYASYPTEIVRRCILAGTSEKGACPACAAPWARVVERTKGDAEALHRPKHLQSAKSTLSLSGNGSAEWAERGSKAQTVGWQASCPHVERYCPSGCIGPIADDEAACIQCGALWQWRQPAPVPCVVLDPFLGSGTTLMVASRLGRDGIGVELNESYAKMAEGKIQRDAGALFPEDIQVTAPRQPTLFDEQEAV